MSQRILAVDDNEIVGWTLAARLWVAGYDVETVRSAGEALAALREGDYALILMDLEMPDTDGLEAAALIREAGLCPDAPIVFLTASEDFADVQRAYGLGARGYLTKAFSPALIRNITRLIEAPDVVWIDDHHCVSREASAPTASGGPRGGAALTLVSDRSGAAWPVPAQAQAQAHA